MCGPVADLADYTTVQREQKYGRNSRIDLLLTDPLRTTTYVEVKNVHFHARRSLAEFPDTVTARGAKHLEELGDMVDAGFRAIMLYVIQRKTASVFGFAAISTASTPPPLSAHENAASRPTRSNACVRRAK